MNRLWAKVFEVSVENNCAFSISSWTNFSGVPTLWPSSVLSDAHLIGEDGVGLDELLGEPVGEPLEDVAAHAGPGAAGDGVCEDEALQRVGALRLAVDYVEDLLVQLPALCCGWFGVFGTSSSGK